MSDHECDPVADTEPAPTPSDTELPIGVDVSAHQRPSSMNWRRLRELGYSFAYIRGVKMGREVDSACREHVERARAEGFSVGLYAFWHPSEDGKEQVQLMADAHAICGVRAGDLAPVLDIESYEPHWRANRDWPSMVLPILEAYTKRWACAIRYHNVADWYLMGHPGKLQEYPLWLADYSPPRDLSCAIWQTKSAPIPGYGTAALDQNVAYELPRIGHPPVIERQRPPLFDLRSTFESRNAAREDELRRRQEQED